MNYLLDTHVFLWLDAEPEKLSRRVAEIYDDGDNRLFLSLASIWEVQIKVQLGKLQLNSPLAELIEDYRTQNRIEFLPVTLNHILALDTLPPRHRDPFDRMLVAQARSENFVLITRDDKLTQYDVRCVW